MHVAALQVEVTEPEAYMYDGEYERKAGELHHPDLINIRQSNASRFPLRIYPALYHHM